MKIQQNLRKLCNRRITTWKAVEDVRISYGSCDVIFTDTLDHKPRVTAKSVPNFEQKQNRKNIVEQITAEVTHDPEMLKYTITSDETWVYGYDVEKHV